MTKGGWPRGSSPLYYMEQMIKVDGEGLLDLVYEPTEKLLRAIDHLEFFLKRGAPRYRDYYEFDVDGRPAKFEKMQVLRVLAEVALYLDVTKAYFYVWITCHTNLGRNAHTIKAMIMRA